MSTTHTVKQGEHLAGIAERFGFRSFKAIWEHPQNAELKKLRKNPNILFPGDVLFIPDLEPKDVSVPTDKKHQFVAVAQGTRIRIKILDTGDHPIEGVCFLETPKDVNIMSREGDIFSSPIDKQVKTAKVQLRSGVAENKLLAELTLAVGSLDPIKTPTGQRERLNNLGYFAGFTEQSIAQLKWALEEFQCDHLDAIKKLNPKKQQADGIFDEAGTEKVLEKAYGM